MVENWKGRACVVQVMQALVEHFVAVGQPERVERCVLKMDILSLDLNQVSWGLLSVPTGPHRAQHAYPVP